MFATVQPRATRVAPGKHRNRDLKFGNGAKTTRRAAQERSSALLSQACARRRQWRQITPFETLRIATALTRKLAD